MRRNLCRSCRIGLTTKNPFSFAAYKIIIKKTSFSILKYLFWLAKVLYEWRGRKLQNRKKTEGTHDAPNVSIFRSGSKEENLVIAISFPSNKSKAKQRVFFSRQFVTEQSEKKLRWVANHPKNRSKKPISRPWKKISRMATTLWDTLRLVHCRLLTRPSMRNFVGNGNPRADHFLAEWGRAPFNTTHSYCPFETDDAGWNVTS